MKCNDCLKEIDEKEYYNRSNEGVCLKCRHKIAQIKYLNKKNNTNIEYIPKRLEEKNKTRKRTNNKVVQNKVEEKLYSKEIEDKVLSDINNTFENNKISINFQEIPPFALFIDMFCSLINIDKGYMAECIRAEDIFNKLERDYQHAYEESKTIEILWERTQMFKCLLDQRRTLKDNLVQYNKILRLLQEIVENVPNVLEKAKESKIELEKVIEIQKNNIYKFEESELIGEEDFCNGKKMKSKKLSKYDVTVPLFNYYGNGSPYLFQRYFLASSVEEAKQNAVKFLQTKFPNCSYKTTDILASIVENNE